MEQRLASLVCIIAGEVLTVYAQVRTATLPDERRRWLLTSPWLLVSWAVSGVCLVGGYLVGGYLVGVGAFGGVWPVTAVSVTSILIVEPVMLFALLRERPSRAESAGLACGLVGLAITLAG